MSLDTWVSIAALGGFAVTVIATVLVTFRRLRSDMGAMRTELKSDIAEVRTELASVRTELKSDIAEVRTELKSDITRLDGRIFVLAAGLKPQIEEAGALVVAAEEPQLLSTAAAGALPHP